MKLSTMILEKILAITLFSTLLAFCISMFFQYNSFLEDKIYIKKEFVKNQKKEIKREVTRVYSLIEYRQNLIHTKIEEKLSKKTKQAYKIARTIYYKNINNKPLKEIKKLIIRSLKNIYLHDESNDFYVNTINGKNILFNDIVNLSTKNTAIILTDAKGTNLTKEHIKIAKEKNEGFTLNYFKEKNKSIQKEYKKIFYIKYFKELDWYMVSSENVKNMRKKVQDNILKEIATFRYDSNGYIFINTYNKKALLFHGKKLKYSKDISKSSNIRQQLSAINNEDGIFYTTYTHKINTLLNYDKISFVKSYDKWQWIIGTGFYLDELKNEVKRKEEILKKNITQQIIIMFLIMFFIFLFIYLLSKRISNNIDLSIKKVLKSFQNASKNASLISTKKAQYKEFIILSKNLNRSLRLRNTAEKKLQSYISLVNNNVLIMNVSTNGIITDFSAAFSTLTQYDKKDLLNKNHKIIIHKSFQKEVYRKISIQMKNNKSWKGEIKILTKNNKVCWIDALIHPSYNNDKHIGYISIMHDITDKKNVEYLSITDELTKLYNRRYFNIKIDQEIKRAKRRKYYIAFIILDIDYFKKYNDTYGHQAGDLALQKVSHILRHKTNRIGDYAFRLGGEEFGLFFLCEKQEEAHSFANIIKDQILDLKIEHKKSDVNKYLSASIGLTIKKGEKISSKEELYKIADDALYQAKKEGRNRISSL